MSNKLFSETEVMMFWKNATEARRSLSVRKARNALSELKVIAMHTDNSALRNRCNAVLSRELASA